MSELQVLGCEHEVMTAERVPLRYRVAGLGSRFLAWLVDAAFCVLLTFAGLLLTFVLEMGRPGIGLAVLQVWVFVLFWGYFLLSEWLWSGQTPGKRLLGIRVIGRSGAAVSFVQAAVRNLLRFVDALPSLLGPGAVGFLTAAGNREQRRLGDLAADTLVVHVELLRQPIQALTATSPGAAQRLAHLRQRVAGLDRERRQLILDLCLRREQLRFTERVRLFHQVAIWLQRELNVGPESAESEEKFILNVASVLTEGAGRS
jgi:uncharacterized RDD family membrane protein YckC